MAGGPLAAAQFRLGGLYEKGLGVDKSLELARRFYGSAGEAGNGKALHNLAVLYVEGIDGKPDYRTAARWFRKAADYGVADSQYNMTYTRSMLFQLSQPVFHTGLRAEIAFTQSVSLKIFAVNGWNATVVFVVKGGKVIGAFEAVKAI